MESEHAAHNYAPIPVVWEKAQGIHVWDPEGRQYVDFLSAYSAANQGHSHPKIVQALVNQVNTCALSSRAFHNAVLPRYAKYITDYFGFEMVLPMNSGAEAVETALKMARKWGYEKKKIPQDQAYVIAAEGCFHGRTIAICSLSNDPDVRSQFGPFLPGTTTCPYNDAEALEKKILELGPQNVAGFLVEPIQGEAGVYVPDDGYLQKCAQICKKYNVLFIADEIQSGLCRTGKLLACDYENLKPDVLILGKALSGGLLPVSAVLSSKEVMMCIKPGEHGSTFGGSPLSCAVGIAALEVLKEEKLAENAMKMGEIFRSSIRDLKLPYIQEVRGKGLLNAVVMDKNFKKSAWELCLLMKDRGILAKPTHGNIIRFTPPLTITETQLRESTKIIGQCFIDIDKN